MELNMVEQPSSEILVSQRDESIIKIGIKIVKMIVSLMTPRSSNVRSPRLD
jgi:hypothetical protein